MGKTDAAMTLFRSTRFEQVANFTADFAFTLGKNYDAKDTLANEMYYPAVALFSVVRDRESDGQLTLVVNTHILYNMKKGHVKLGMLVLIFKTILKLKSQQPISSVFFCGDFNTIANSMLYSYIARGEVNLDADLGAYSNQGWATNMHGKREPKEEVRIQDYKFKLQGSHPPVKIDHTFAVELANCQVELIEGSKVVFRRGHPRPMSTQEIEDYFQSLSDQVYLRSAYASVNRQLARRRGYENKDKNFEEGITFFVNTMSSTVDYIWCASDYLTVNAVLEKPGLDYLQTLPKTAPIADFPSDHFCLFAEYVREETDKKD